MNTSVLLIVLAMHVSANVVFGQSTTTEALQKKHGDALNLFFYNNTLRMLNQQEDPEFDELIREIEKMRFLMIKKSGTNFGSGDYKKLLAEYKAEAFEEIMTSRHDGKTFDVYLKEKNGETKGMLVLINDASTLYILDILGRVALDKVTSLYSTLDESTDIGSRIKAFTGADNDENEEKDEDEEKREN